MLCTVCVFHRCHHLTLTISNVSKYCVPNVLQRFRFNSLMPLMMKMHAIYKVSVDRKCNDLIMLVHFRSI